MTRLNPAMIACRLLALALASAFAGYGLSSCPSDKAPESGPVRQVRSPRLRDAMAVDQADAPGREWRSDSEDSHSRRSHAWRRHRQPTRDLPVAAVDFQARPEFVINLAPVRPAFFANRTAASFPARAPPRP